MKISKFLIALFAVIICFSSCKDDEYTVSKIEIPTEILVHFQTRYPLATDVRWAIRDQYAVASFCNHSSRNSPVVRNATAWFELEKFIWSMGREQISFEDLSPTIRQAFAASDYSKSPWKLNSECQVLDREQMESIYTIVVHYQSVSDYIEVKLYYTADGVLIRFVVDASSIDDDRYLPVKPNVIITEWMAMNYRGGYIVDLDYDDSMLKVDFVYNYNHYQALFDQSNVWVATKQELRQDQFTEIPAAVMQTIKSWPDYVNSTSIEDIDTYITAKHGNYYVVELESPRHKNGEICISEQGEIIDQPYFGNISLTPGQSAISKFIEAKYPKAIITKRDERNGYLYIEIDHKGVEKELLFSGRNEWVKSWWGVKADALPSGVLALLNKDYKDYQIDNQAEYIETSLTAWYEIEVQSMDNDDLKYLLLISPRGELLMQIKK